jgi:hypothetical protein
MLIETLTDISPWIAETPRSQEAISQVDSF